MSTLIKWAWSMGVAMLSIVYECHDSAWIRPWFRALSKSADIFGLCLKFWTEIPVSYYAEYPLGLFVKRIYSNDILNSSNC